MAETDLRVLAINNKVRVEHEENLVAGVLVMTVVGKERNRIRFMDSVERVRPIGIQYIYKQRRFGFILLLKKHFKQKFHLKGGEKQ